MQTAILVVGMHRSGTSATAGALELCGVALGSELLPPGEDNPKGYFEHERAVAIDERLLAALGSGWADARPLPAGWAEGAAAREAVAEIDALLAADFGTAPLFALKDPRMCRLLPAWLEALRARGIRAVALFVARDPAEVAASIEARNGWAPPLGELLWLRHVCDAEAATRGIQRTAISYAGLLADPAGSLRAALGRLGVELPSVADEALRAFADAGQRHQRGRGEAATHLFAAPVAQAQAALDAIAAGGGGWEAIADAGAALDAIWQRSGGSLDALAAMAMDVERKARALRDDLEAENARMRSELIAQIAWSEAAVAERERLLAERFAERDRLQAERYAERDALQAELAGVRSDFIAQVRWSEQAVADWEARAERYEHELDASRHALDEAGQALAESRRVLAAREDELAAMLGSMSWRLTRPLRALKAFADKTFTGFRGRHR